MWYSSYDRRGLILWSDMFWYFCLIANIRHTLSFLPKQWIYWSSSDPLSFVFSKLKKFEFQNQNLNDPIPHHCYWHNKKVNKYSICPLVRTAPQWLPWIRPQGWRYRSDRIPQADVIMLFLFYVQVVGKLTQKYTKPGTNSLRVFMRSKYSQHVLAYLSSTENSTSLQLCNLMSQNVCRGLNRDFLMDKIIS